MLKQADLDKINNEFPIVEAIVYTHDKNGFIRAYSHRGRSLPMKQAQTLTKKNKNVLCVLVGPHDNAVFEMEKMMFRLALGMVVYGNDGKPLPCAATSNFWTFLSKSKNILVNEDFAAELAISASHFEMNK